MASINTDHPILLFDGVCNLCNGFVQFVINRDPEGHFRFAALQSAAAQDLLKAHNISTKHMDTVVLVENGNAYVRSEVALRMAPKLGGLWPVLGIFRILPLFIRDPIYDFIAKNRYRWFGEKDQCMIPTPELKGRFLA